jgi:hypothetical protein
VLGFAVLFATLSKLCKNAGSNSFHWAKLACFVFFSSNFNLSDQILSTGGVALNHCSLLILTLLSCSSLFMQMLCTQEIEKPYTDTNSKKKKKMHNVKSFSQTQLLFA